MDDDEGTASQGYYLQPCDSGLRDSKRYVESPVHSPSSEFPNAVGGAEGIRYAYKVENLVGQVENLVGHASPS